MIVSILDQAQQMEKGHNVLLALGQVLHVDIPLIMAVPAPARKQGMLIIAMIQIIHAMMEAPIKSLH
jgi:hypothetical protein